MTLAERCAIAQQCIPPSEFRERLTALHAELLADTRRLDWLADPAQSLGNVQLPKRCVAANPHCLRAAIDDAMEGEA